MNKSWNKIFKDYKIANHDFSQSPFHLSANQIKITCQRFKETRQKEPRILCKQDSRESRPDVFKKHGLFLLPTKNGYYSIIQGEGYVYAASLMRTFMQDDTLILTIRGRKYTPEFEFFVGKQKLKISSVQTEVDAGYEGKNQVVLIEAKNTRSSNVIIRQLYYPFRQWQKHTKKKVISLFFEKSSANVYSIWQFKFSKKNSYNSIKLIRSKKFQIIES